MASSRWSGGSPWAGGMAATTPRVVPASTPRATSATWATVKPKLLEDRRGGGRGAEMLEADHGAVEADPAVPAERGAGLDADPRPHGRRQDRVAVARRLRGEALPAGQGDDACGDALGLQARRGRPWPAGARSRWRAGSRPAPRPRRSHRRRRPGRSRRAPRPRAPGRPCRPGRAASGGSATAPTGPSRVLDRQRARPRPPRWRRPAGRTRRLRHRPQGGVVLDRLVGRPVLAEADRVVGPDVDHVQPGEGGQADRRRACSR